MAPTASSPEACWAAMSSGSLVVYLTTLFGAHMCYMSHALCTLLLNVFGSVPQDGFVVQLCYVVL
jgi:hypothetical protein